ncbi:MAG: peptide chain release factor 1 [Opitutales bacterium]|nr:peptide chain release factor 1 [Opitutales bacterium]MBQ2722363.1 peptide chain release factor 1 [Opitutales bacterium]
MEGIPPIQPFLDRLADLDKKMAEPDFYNDQRTASAISREQQQLSKLRELYEGLENDIKQIDENKKIIEENADPEFVEMAKEDVAMLEERIEPTKKEILKMMIPADPTDSRNTVVEIRAGTGGDEASLFASDLYRMYCRYADSRGWKVENLSMSESPAGGFKEICFLLSGDDVYRSMKYECGTHRVQRVPVTEAAGRIHTSAATVAILPEAEEVDIHIDPNEIEISIARASGPGGQGVNTTDSAVQILHKPTGMIVKCADERSQLKNKTKALKVLRSRLLEMKQQEERDKYAANRREQIGSGDRSERIRTYNYPQSRITDHRIGMTIHSLPQFMDGEISDMIQALEEADYVQKIQALTEK